MHLGLEATAACRPVKTGIARYAHNLMAALVAEGRGQGIRCTAFASLSRRWKKGWNFDAIEGLDWRWYAGRVPVLRDAPDLIHGLEMRVPRVPGAARVATLHDVFGMLPGNLLPPKACERNAVRYAEMAKTCHHVIADSQCTADDFLRYFDYPEDQVHVVHLAVDDCFHARSQDEHDAVRERLGLEGPYLLYVGDLTPRKNLLRLLQGFAASHARKDHTLVIAGARCDGADELAAAIDACPAGDCVRVLGWTPDEDLRVLYSGAQALLFPSLYEGFGLPILEAFASETPALGGDVGAVPGVAGGHATLVDPLDVDSIAAGIDAVIETSPERIAAAREYARGFTWKRCAQETMAVYRQALRT